MWKFLVLAAVLGLALTAPAAAQDAPRSVTVRFDDLNLAHEADADRMLWRIERAARRACSLDVHAWGQRVYSRACARRAVREAVAAIAHPTLAMRYSRRIGDA